MSENILEMQNVTTCVNEGTSEEKEILKNISLTRSKLPETTSRNFQSSNAPASFRRSSKIPKQARHHE